MICVTRQPARDKGHLWSHGNGTQAQRGFCRLRLGVQGFMALAMSAGCDVMDWERRALVKGLILPSSMHVNGINMQHGTQT